jgi:hypothetical protein
MFRIVFWDVLPCKMIVDRRSRGAYCLHHQGQYAPLKRRSTIILHGSTSQKTILNIILAAVRTWNLICLLQVSVFFCEKMNRQSLIRRNISTVFNTQKHVFIFLTLQLMKFLFMTLRLKTQFKRSCLIKVGTSKLSIVYLFIP